MDGSHTDLIELVNQHDGKKTVHSVLKFLSRHLFLILVLLWTPLILMQTWNIQHSCSPLVNWGEDRCPIERVTVSPRELKLKIGKLSQLKTDVRVTNQLRNASTVDRGVRWISSNEKVATVNAQGQILAVAPGIVKITAISKKDKTKSDTVDFLVEGITNIEIQPKSLALEVGQARTLISKVNGFGKFDTGVNWSSANKEIATVDNSGLVKGIAQGETTIQAVSEQDTQKSVSTKLKVSHNMIIERVIINNNEPINDLRAGEIKTITARVEGLGSNSEDITWSSSNSDVAIILGQGHTAELEAMSTGEVTIIATSTQDSSKKAMIQLEVLPATVNYIAVYPKQLELDINNIARLCSTIKGIGSIDKSVYWSSSNDQIATVNSEGLVTAKSKGEVQIIATSKQNSDQSASTKLKIPRGIDWLAISTGSIVTAGATLVGVPLPAAIALGSATATGIHNWQAVDPFLCR
ncbi:Ig-like domain-containing protein [Nostoc sp. FACHB-888]|uniref:Ig-like domain-containing protein n=1 Tax=Nostoc sp. FACHB-888 TaxID=2692842 RepID=UPI001687D7FA|nr:Ig-like domain-containing protein [Nostoc sp. FACHB-888]MBD2248746.1 Ig-like domain-containing protein [Nostoc sp. FACHB-888]